MYYALANVFDWNLWPWKWRSRTVAILMKIGRRRKLANLQMCADIGASRFTRLFVVHNRKFRKWRTYGRIMRIINKKRIINENRIIYSIIKILSSIIANTPFCRNDVIKGNGVRFSFHNLFRSQLVRILCNIYRNSWMLNWAPAFMAIVDGRVHRLVLFVTFWSVLCRRQPSWHHMCKHLSISKLVQKVTDRLQ